MDLRWYEQLINSSKNFRPPIEGVRNYRELEPDKYSSGSSSSAHSAVGRHRRARAVGYDPGAVEAGCCKSRRDAARTGLGQQDAVAIVMPNGPEMAVLFPAVACWAIAVSLNAAYREDEFDFYLGDLAAKVVIVTSGSDSPVRAVAANRGIVVIELFPDAGRSGGTIYLYVTRLCGDTGDRVLACCAFRRSMGEAPREISCHFRPTFSSFPYPFHSEI